MYLSAPIPLEIINGLDNVFRNLVQNPKNILKDYVKEGMTVLDVGCCFFKK